MKESTRRLLLDLAKAIEHDPRVLRLRQDEAELSADEGVAPLLEEAKKRREDYLVLRLELGENDEKTVDAKRAFYQAKLHLDENQASAQYRHSYASVSDLYREIDEIIFAPYRRLSGCKETHAAG